jgi:serine/threonine protein kinase
MAQSIECPKESVLVGYAQGALEASQAENVKAHLEICRPCTDALQWIQSHRIPVAGDESSIGSASSGAKPGAVSSDKPNDSSTASAVFAEPSLTCELDQDCDEFGDGKRFDDAEESEDAESAHRARFDFSVLAPSPNPEALGRLGKYEVLGVIGHGGMGLVFKARDAQLLRTVAIKMPTRELSANPIARRRFIREARAAAAVNHPNVVTIHAVEEHENNPFLVMEFIDGKSLRDRVRDEHRLEPLEVIRLAAQIAAGLAAAHSQGVIHRDIKPGNVMLENGVERVKITDFGLARATIDNIDLTSRELAVGTPAYMSPEQVTGGEIGARADLFGLGCVMYAMVTGHSPFHGKMALEMAHKVVEYDPPPLHETNPNVPRFLSEIVTKLLQKDPEKRYQSAAEVADLLNRHLAILNQTPTEDMGKALQKTLIETKPKREERHWIVGISIVLLIGLGSLPFWLPGRLTTGGNVTLPNIPNGDGRSVIPVPPTPPKYLTVSQTEGVPGTYKTIREALAEATPSSTIEIMDEATYQESIEIKNPSKLLGVQLITKHGARITPSPDTTEPYNVVTINGTPDVVIKGFHIQAIGNHGLAITGASPGVRIENVHFSALQPSHRASVLIRNATGTTQERPIVIRDCNFDVQNLGVFVEGTSDTPASFVRLQNNRFIGKGKHVELTAARDVELTGNIFTSGTGVTLHLPSAAVSKNLVIANNTFYSPAADPAGTWLDLANSTADLQGIAICNNLVLEVTDIGAGFTTTLDRFAEQWTFANNYWQPGANTNLYRLQLVAEPLLAIELLSKDPASADYLRPVADALPAVDDAGGKALGYVGAQPPQPAGPVN